MAGHQVTIGSRDAARAADVAAGLVAETTTISGAIAGATNEDAAAGRDLVVVATPWDGAVATVKPLAATLEGKVVVSMVNALMKEGSNAGAPRVSAFTASLTAMFNGLN